MLNLDLVEERSISEGSLQLPPPATGASSVISLGPGGSDSHVLIGRSTESQRIRQNVYLGQKTEGFAADEAPGDITCSTSGVVPTTAALVKMLLEHNTYRQNFNDCDATPFQKPSFASTFLERWLHTAPAAAGTSPTSKPAAEHDSFTINCLDVNQDSETLPLWWTLSSELYTAEQLQDVPPDMFMEICYPQQGFYVKMRDEDVERYDWNERFQAIFNIGETSERRVRMADFVRLFSTAAMPFAVEVLANVENVPSPIIHRAGITVELQQLTPPIKVMFDGDPLRAQKVCNREFNGRNFAACGACPQLNVPFTLLVEYMGHKALVYPRVPLVHQSVDPSLSPPKSTITGRSIAPIDELVYGMHHPEWFHEDSFRQTDSEVNAVIQRLAMITKCKGCWLGKEFKDKKFVHGSVDMQVFRSGLDNRIYAHNLRRLTAANSVNVPNGLAHEADDEEEGVFEAEDIVCAHQQPNDYFLHRFRPEFVRRYQRLDLSMEIPSPIAKINTDHDEADRVSQLDILFKYLIPQAAEQLSRDTRLNGVGWPFFRQGGLSHFLHSWGVNMRHIPLIHQKLVRTKLSGLALMFVELEIVARALKHWILSSSLNVTTGEFREYLIVEKLTSILLPFSSTFWASNVWPAIVKKYPFYGKSTVQRWDHTRVDHDKVVQRVLRMMGAIVVMSETEAIVETLDWIVHPDHLNTVQLKFYPVVKCPLYPTAPLEEGQDVHLMILAKKYLREVSYDLKFNPVSNREMLDRYIAFLEQMGEKNCEEVLGFYIAEQERKDRVLKGSKPVYAEAGKDDKTIKYRLRDNRGMRVLDISREGCERFKFLHGQTVQQTLGAEAGRLSTIVGVLDGVLFHHEEGADGAVELMGRNYNELQCNYGFVLLDKMLNMKRFQQQIQQQNTPLSQLPPITAHDVKVVRPYHQVGDRGMVVFESHPDALLEQFNVESGQRLMFTGGPKRGLVTTVLGAVDGVLWHQLDNAIQCEAIRPPSSQEQHVTQTSNKQAPSSSFTPASGDGGKQQFCAFDAVTLARTKLWYPIDPTVVYDDSLEIFAGFRSCVNLGFFYRQVVVFQKGPYQGNRGVILGAHAGVLQALIPFAPLPINLGSTGAEIIEMHAPHIVGTLSYNPVREPAPNKLWYPCLGGEPVAFDVSYAACLPFGAVRGQRIKVVVGLLAGLCGFVVGYRKKKLWAQLDGETGAQPLISGAFKIIKGRIFEPDLSIHVPPESVSEAEFLAVFPHQDPSGNNNSKVMAQARDISFPFLACFGHIVTFDASPAATDSFGYYHSQRLRIQRNPRTHNATSLSADVLYVVVVGVFHGELFYVIEGEPCARPFAARSRYQLDCMYAPETVGLCRLMPWNDAFCGNINAIQMSAIDAFYEVPHIHYAFSMDDQCIIGLDTSNVSQLYSAWKSGTTIIRQDRIVSEHAPDGCVHHRPDGPQATVIGTSNDNIYIELRSSYDATIGKSNASSSLRQVTVLSSKECSRWLICPGWKNRERQTYLMPEEIKKSDNYVARLELETVSSPCFSVWWGYMMTPEDTDSNNSDKVRGGVREGDTTPCGAAAEEAVPTLILFDRTTSQRLEKLYEKGNGKRTGSHYDVDGGSYYMESMTYKLPRRITDEDSAAPRVYPMVREALESVSSYCQFAFSIDLKGVFPELHDAVQQRALRMIAGKPGMSARTVTIRKSDEIVFAQSEIDMLHEACEVVPALVINELERHAQRLTASEVLEVELRYASVPTPIRLPMLRWVLSILGVVPLAPTTLQKMYCLLVAMERAMGRITDLPLLEEYEQYVIEQLTYLVELETSRRLSLMQEERNWWLKMLPRRGKRVTKSTRVGGSATDSADMFQEELSSYDSASLRVMRSSLSVSRQKFSALMEHKTPLNVKYALQLPTMGRLTLQDGNTIIMEPSCMSFQRGDIIEYTLGDVQGMRATILGMYGGLLWRYEHSGVYKNKSMPFAGTEQDIMDRYGLKLIKREDVTKSRILDDDALNIRDSSTSVWLCYDGASRSMNPSFHVLLQYGVCAGDRLITTSETNLDVFPFENLVIVIVGVCEGRLWFAVDQTGAIPFPDDPGDVKQRFSLRQVCAGPVRIPSVFDPTKLLPCQGTVGPAEGEVIGKIGPMTMVFIVAAELLRPTPSGTRIMFLSGEHKGRRCAIVGLRHGRWWVLWEHETAARALREPLTAYEIKVLSPDVAGGFRSFESTTSVTSLNITQPPPDEPWLRFPTQRGGLALFQTNSFELFHLHSGQQVMYSIARKKGLPKKKAIIVGTRDGALWKVDEYESDAKPFIGVVDMATLQKKFDVTPGPVVVIESQTW